MIPSPFTAELARQHRVSLLAARAGVLANRRRRRRAVADELRRLAAVVRPGPVACATC